MSRCLRGRLLAMAAQNCSFLPLDPDLLWNYYVDIAILNMHLEMQYGLIEKIFPKN